MGDIERVRNIQPAGFQRVNSDRERKRRESEERDERDEDVIELHAVEESPPTEPEPDPPAESEAESRLDIRS